MHNIKYMALGVAVGCALASCLHKADQDWPFDNTMAIIDTEGNTVNCHGGNFFQTDTLTYWYGESRPLSGFISEGVALYTSPDLKKWTNRGIVLQADPDSLSPLAKGCIIERPKVVKNPQGKYVMWFHHELPGRGYEAAHAAVGISDSPTGPFRLIRSGRVNPGVMPLNLPDSAAAKAGKDGDFEWWTPEWRQAVHNGLFVMRDLDGGQMSRDMTIFIDPDDSTAYHIYSSEENLTLQIAELNDDYTAHTGRYIRVSPAGHNEAPAVFKHNGTYWMICSGCTGWEPNRARLLRSSSMLGEWEQLDSTPCTGPGPNAKATADNTFASQSAFIAYVNGEPVLACDRWRPRSLAQSPVIFLPITFPDSLPRVTYK